MLCYCMQYVLGLLANFEYPTFNIKLDQWTLGGAYMQTNVPCVPPQDIPNL